MKKDTSLPSFVPLSSGKFMSDVWWEPTDVEVRPAKKKGGLPWILVAVKMFFDFGGNTLDVDSEAECRNMYRLSVFDALYIAFLRMRMLADIHSEIYPADYEKWLEFMQKDLGYKEGDSMIEFAAKCLKVALESALVRLPGTFRIMFQKKPHMALADTEKYSHVLNRNSLVCEAESSDFKYEIKVGIFIVGEEKKMKLK